MCKYTCMSKSWHVFFSSTFLMMMDHRRFWLNKPGSCSYAAQAHWIVLFSICKIKFSPYKCSRNVSNLASIIQFGKKRNNFHLFKKMLIFFLNAGDENLFTTVSKKAECTKIKQYCFGMKWAASLIKNVIVSPAMLVS